MKIDEITYKSPLTGIHKLSFEKALKIANNIYCGIITKKWLELTNKKFLNYNFTIKELLWKKTP